MTHGHHERRLLREDSEQRESHRGPPRAQGARRLAPRLYRLVEDHGARGLPGIAGLPAHRRLGRPERLGQVRLCAHAGISLGHPARARREGPQGAVRPALWRAGLAGGAGRGARHAAPPRGDPGRHRARLGRAAAPSRQDRALALRHAQPVPGERRGGPAPVGHGLYPAQVFRPRRPRGGGGAAAPALRQRGQAAHARRLQRGDAGLAVLLHVHLLHRPRRQDAARKPRAIGLRSALAHLPLHADRGSPPHVRGRDRHRPHHPAHLRSDEGGGHRGSEREGEGARARRHRSADHPEEAQSALFALARPVRLGGFDQRRQCLQRRPQGPLPGDQDQGRPPAGELDLSGAQAHGRRDQARRRAGADRAQHAPARRLHQGLRARPRPLEQGDREHRH